MTTIKAHFDGKVLVPHGPVALPVNQEVTLQFAAEVAERVERARPAQAGDDEFHELFAELGDDGPVESPRQTSEDALDLDDDDL